ncbi:MAG: response regulator, partial [Thalassolituus sp.]
RQILMNFLSNATKFTPERGEVCVRMSGTHNLTDFVLFLSVRDTGIGIPQSRMDDIFQPYDQGAEEIGRLYGGSGLGLSLCHNLAGLMGGSIGVMSREKKGSTFWVEVPLKAAASDFDAVAAQGCSLKVAVCEDDATNRKTLQVILEKRGFCVQVFSDGNELLADAGWRQADIILMDCHMPNMNGMDATRELRRAGCSVPVVALTAGVTDAERQACLDAGMDFVMAKPVDFSVLHEQLLAHVNHGRHPIRLAE